MCGFAGIVTWDNRHRVHRDVLERMSARIAHRGPDGQGLWINHDEEATAERPQVGLVHRRLAILDPDPRSNQPFTDGRGNWLVFNGEIYNFRELRQELSSLRPNYAWRTTGDTEVLLLAYDVWRMECLEKLNGMFAFAIWDEQQKELILARDRMGQKPLYTAFAVPADGGSNVTIAFASELAPLRCLPWIKNETRTGAVAEYLRWGYVPHAGTIYDGIHSMFPGKGSQWRRRSIANRHYFHLTGSHVPTLASVDDQVARRTTRELLTQAVQRQLVSDVPLGCFLSGGVDSSIVAACMRATGQRTVTFSIGFDDPRYDESEFAAKVAKHLGTEHHTFTVRPDAIHDLPALAAVFGEPFADSSALPTHYLARETRRHVKVALSGDGGDELFGGYARYRAIRLAHRLQSLPRPIRASLKRSMELSARGTHPKSLSSRLRRLFSPLQLSLAEQYASYMRLFDDATIATLLIRDELPCESPYAVTHTWADEFRRGRDTVQTSLAVDRVTYLPDDLLTKVDRCSMLHALEVRSPFMDPDLVRFASTLTTPQLLKGGPKRMLREAFAADLPAWVFKRKKMGFAVPIGEWFRSSLRPMLHDHLFAANSFAASHFNMAVVRRLVDEHETHRVDHSQRLYALLMLELWWRTQKA
jgi:asparagine synthase (glutamine-hydrolysing)